MCKDLFKIKNAHCSYCGGLFLEGKFPQTCLICTNTTWLNPLPISVTLVPCFLHKNSAGQSGILLVRRSIEPKMGELALPGGYIELGETWEAGAVREVKEEIGLELDPHFIELLSVKNSNNGNILIFSLYSKHVYWEDIKFTPNREVSEVIISYGMDELAFPTHREAINNYFFTNS